MTQIFLPSFSVSNDSTLSSNGTSSSSSSYSSVYSTIMSFPSSSCWGSGLTLGILTLTMAFGASMTSSTSTGSFSSSSAFSPSPSSAAASSPSSAFGSSSFYSAAGSSPSLDSPALRLIFLIHSYWSFLALTSLTFGLRVYKSQKPSYTRSKTSGSSPRASWLSFISLRTGLPVWLVMILLN